MSKSVLMDRFGIVMAAACILHCLALPVLGVMIPLLGVAAENEALHRGLAVAAGVIALIAFSMRLP